MIIVVDAYNFLHSIPSYKKALTDLERIKFIQFLGSYGKCKNHKMVLVFDGGPFDCATKENIYSVYTVYSGVNRTADDYIKKYLELNKAKDLLLVSSDSDLVRYADHLSIASIGSSDFYRVVKQALSHNNRQSTSSENNTIKMTKEVDSDVDDLMYSLVIMSSKVEDFVSSENNRHLKKKQLSKNERISLKKLHKL